MFRINRNITLLLAFASIIIAPQAIGHKSGGVVVNNAWVREAPPTSPVMAGYMIIENHTDKPKELTSVKSSAFQKIEIHQTVHKDGMASMEGQKSLTIDAEKSVELKPGGTHLMLINPTSQLKAGDKVNFELTFANGSKTIISVPVKKATSSQHHDHGDSAEHKHIKN